MNLILSPLTTILLLGAAQNTGATGRAPLAFVSTPSVTSTSIKKARAVCPSSLSSASSSSSASKSKNDELLNGANTIEEWFRSITKDAKNDNETLNYVRHNVFSNGRGLEYIPSKAPDPETDVITLPKEYVLRSTIVQDKDELDSIADDWDIQLAIKLLKECALGEASSLYGYCSLLTRGNLDCFSSSSSTTTKASSLPPSTAPDTIRNWTDAQKQRLSTTERGRKLLSASETQNQEWIEKYNALPPSTRNTYTQEQVFWAMEAVNSRAFKGDFSGGGDDGNGGSVLKQLSNALIPFAAAAFGYSYITYSGSSSTLQMNDSVALGLAVVATAPALLNVVSDVFGDDMDAVLLPIIDSANHKQEARSTIELNPLKGAFTIKIAGRNCVVKDDNADDGSKKRQLYISYGEKSDPELLLNYGFLKDTVIDSSSGSDDDDVEPRDTERRQLAEIFTSRSQRP